MDEPPKLSDPVRRTPLDVKLFLLLGDVAPGLLALFAFARGLLASAQLFATANRRVIASAVWVFLFVIVWLYLYWRKPWSIGLGGITQKITHPKLRHWLYLVGVLVFTWAPAVPWLMPSSQLEQATALEIQRQVSVLEEKTRMADLLYGRMRDDEDRAERFSKFPLKLRLLLPPPTPYAGLAERLQADAEFSLAEYLYHAGHGPEAIPHFKEAQRLSPDNWNYKRQAWTLSDAGRDYGTNFAKEVQRLNGKPYYAPRQMPEPKKKAN